MSLIEAIILGIIQGLTEFLPVSSSGHIELGKHFLNTNFSDNLLFSLVLHLGTVLSTIIIFRHDIIKIFKDLFTDNRQESISFIVNVLVSMLPILFIGLKFKDQIDQLFTGNVKFVGFMLLITGLLLFICEKGKWKDKKLNKSNAFIIGIAQAIAALPGISRSGATIATGMLLGLDKNKVAKFSFLMVIPPIVGASILDIKDLFDKPANLEVINWMPLIAGFIAAFLTGLFACRLMLKIVRNGKLSYFAIYCFAVGLLAIFFS